MTKTKTVNHTFTLTDNHIRAMLEYLNADEQPETRVLEPITDQEKLDLLNTFTSYINEATTHPERIADDLEWPDKLYNMMRDWSIDDASYRQLTGDTYEVTIDFDIR